jgi:signal transducer and activator of transcription 5B
MALWAKILLLPSEAMQQVQSCYGADFSLEVRHFLADWIEERLL